MFRYTIRLDLIAFTACLLVAVALGFGWYLERLNVRDAQAKAGQVMRAYLAEVLKNRDLQTELEALQSPRGDQ